MTLRTHLVLGRVSNLPTVWTNALAGAGLAGAGLTGAALSWPALIVVMLALSLFYIGGMYLNDAFDAEIDARERPNRPIPSGAIANELVYTLGYGFLLIGVLLTLPLGLGPALAAIALAAAVILYDWQHKRTALAPLLMGACRFLSYVVAALAAGGLTNAALIGGLGLFAHTIGLTYAAKQEAYDRVERAWPLAVVALPALIGLWFALASGSLVALVLLGLYAGWSFGCVRLLFRRQKGDVPRAVVRLIAAIALYDAVMIAAVGAPSPALLALAGFLATLALQRVAPGT
jgi:4-hydroxybenzoate polyprenyltransferase